MIVRLGHVDAPRLRGRMEIVPLSKEQFERMLATGMAGSSPQLAGAHCSHFLL